MSTPQMINPTDGRCGMSCCYPSWLQRYANTRTFTIVYGLLGTILAIPYIYLSTTITTLEKRYNLQSQTTGMMLSGNEISQILFALALTYIAGQRNRPRWIAFGILCSGLSCLIMLLPHFIYGIGEDAIKLTEEYYKEKYVALPLMNTSQTTLAASPMSLRGTQSLCGVREDEECNKDASVMPKVLIFLSQFGLGIGNTLYYTLGATYIDDNAGESNSPLIFSIIFSLRMIGPLLAFPLSSLCLSLFIDPTKTPIINRDDPRWVGAWWLGWLLTGSLLIVLSGLIALFPKTLPKRAKRAKRLSMPNDIMPMRSNFSSNIGLDTIVTQAKTDLPTIKEFPNALMRLLKNKLLMLNTIAATFYIFGGVGFMTFISKYMEIQFLLSPRSAVISVGPLSVTGMVIGMLASGIVLSKKTPATSKVLMWNVIISTATVIEHVLYLFMYCPDPMSISYVTGELRGGLGLNLTMPCNTNCSCTDVRYSPVCHAATGEIFFSACHAGCKSWSRESKLYSDCSCLLPDSILPQSQSVNNFRTTADADDSGTLRPGLCSQECHTILIIFAVTTMVVSCLNGSGRVGNMLVNYRAVDTKDKTFAQGLTIMIFSIFALIPAPIIFGRIIDSTCLVWSKTCSRKGNCQLYDQRTFRQSINFLYCGLTSCGVFFDILVWYYGKQLDLYGNVDVASKAEKELTDKENQTVAPLLAAK